MILITLNKNAMKNKKLTLKRPKSKLSKIKRAVKIEAGLLNPRSRAKKLRDSVENFLAENKIVFKKYARIDEYNFDFLLKHKSIFIECRSCYWDGCTRDHPDSKVDVVIKNKEYNLKKEKVVTDKGFNCMVLWDCDSIEDHLKFLREILCE